MSFIVAIDGPAGTGKGTITKLIAKDFGLINIDTGATYRCVTLEMINQNVSINEKDKIIKISETIKIGIQTIFLNGEDVTDKIRSKEVTALVSQVSAIVEVRLNMVKLQRKLAEGKDVIMEGRDITTYVFPNADVKIYLDADVKERARRRYKENLEKGINMTYEEVLEKIKIRDHNDSNKEIGSLKIAEDAIVIDTTYLTIEQVKEKVADIINKAKGGQQC
jgi:cytidylate kinase